MDPKSLNLNIIISFKGKKTSLLVSEPLWGPLENRYLQNIPHVRSGALTGPLGFHTQALIPHSTPFSQDKSWRPVPPLGKGSSWANLPGLACL